MLWMLGSQYHPGNPDRCSEKPDRYSGNPDDSNGISSWQECGNQTRY